MGVFNRAIPKLTYDTVNQYRTTPVPEYYVDDIFDPIFNARVKDALRQQYGNAFLGTVGGYSELVNNALFGQMGRYGIFGPGMGILSTFGRSMDKADDFIIGGLTEGVKGITGQGIENPLRNIFVEDQDYTGKRLIAAMANSMSKFAGGAKLDESDLNAVPWTIIGTGLDLATDPSILGGAMVKASEPAATNVLQNLSKAETPIGKIGSFLRNYDDVMARVASDVTAPGLRHALKSLRGKLENLIPTEEASDFTQVVLEDVKIVENYRQYPPEVVKEAQKRLQENTTLQQMVQINDEITDAEQQVPVTEPEPVEPVITDLSDETSKTDVQTLLTRAKNAATVDLETLKATEEAYIKSQNEHVKNIDKYTTERAGEITKGLGDAIDYLHTRGAKETAAQIFDGENVWNTYKNAAETAGDYYNSPERVQEYIVDDLINSGAWQRFLEDVNPEYADIDLSETAFLNNAFSPNEAANRRAIQMFTEVPLYKKVGKPPKSDFTLIPSETTSVSTEALSEGNQFANKAILKPFIEAADAGIIPKFTNRKEFQAALDSKGFNELVREIVPKKYTKRPIYRDLESTKELSGVLHDLKAHSGDFANCIDQLHYLHLTSPTDIPKEFFENLLEKSKPEAMQKALFELTNTRTGIDTFIREGQNFHYRPQNIKDLKYALVNVAFPPKTYAPYLDNPTKRARYDDMRMFQDVKRLNELFAENVVSDGSGFVNGIGEALDDINEVYLSPVKAKLSSGTSPIFTDIDSPVYKGGKGDDALTTYADLIADPDSVPEYGEYNTGELTVGGRPRDRVEPESLYTGAEYMVRQLLADPSLGDDPRVVTELNKRLKGYRIRFDKRMTKDQWHTFFEKYKDVPEVMETKFVWSDFNKACQEASEIFVKKIDYGNWWTAARKHPDKFPILANYLDKNNPYSSIFRKMLQERTIKTTDRYTNVLSFNGEYNPLDGNTIFNSLMLEDKVVTKPVKAFLPDITLDGALTLNNFYRTLSKTGTAKNKISRINLDTPKVRNAEPVLLPAAQAQTIEAADDTTAAKLAFEAPSSQDSVVDQTVEEFCPDVAKLKTDGHSDGYIERHVEKTQWDLYSHIMKARSVQASAGAGKRYSIQSKQAQELFRQAANLKATPKEVKDTFTIMTYYYGDTLKSTDFATEMRRTGTIFAPVDNRVDYSRIKPTLQHNVDVYNAAAGSEVFKYFERKLPDKMVIGITLNKANPDAAKSVIELRGKLEKAPFQDIVFVEPRKLTAEERAFITSDRGRSIVNFLKDVDGLTKEQARVLGFQFDEKGVYTKHVMDVNPETASFLANDVYGDDVDMEAVEDFQDVIASSNAYRDQDVGALGTQLRDRKIRGAYWLLDTERYPLFTYDLTRYAKGSLGDGMFANSKYQTLAGIVFNDDFKLQSIKSNITVEDLTDILYAGGAEGRYSGNLYNLDLIAPVYDDNGRVVKLKRFDKFSQKGLQEALNNPDTVLVQANVVDSIDKTLRKEVRMSNKFYRFINQHFTTPFKFGVLTNPGFAVGNINDAAVKQATTMSQKYGTSMATETKNVQNSIDSYLKLGNEYNNVMDKWFKIAEDNDIELTGPERIPELVASNGTSRKRLMQYINGGLYDKKGNPILCELSEREIGTIYLWSDLQTITHGTVNMHDFDEVLEAEKTSRFKRPTNIFDRVVQGTAKYNAKDPKTWGAVANNPVSRTSTKVAGTVEDIFRGSSILNDLQHQGYTIDSIRKLYNINPELDEEALRNMYGIDLENATNAMYNANFNYDRMSDFTDTVGKYIPFPTFFLKNFTYWMHLYASNPRYFAIALRLHNSIWSGRNTSKDEFAAEAKGRGAIPVGDGKLNSFFKGIFKPTPLQSMFSAFNMLNNPTKDLAYRTHPLVQTGGAVLGQIKPNSDLTTSLGNKYRPYSTNPYEKNIVQGDKKFNPLAFAAHRANPYERTINTYLRTPSKIKHKQAQLSDFLPSLFQPDFSKK